ncbi:MAG: hypothetical protein JST39_12985 [Bacteroidetes bacterium]|nr:hypothetical protein [Bacteroidota bacterium]
MISDNRYGLHHPEITSVFITHQLQIKSSLGKWVDRLLRKMNYRYIRRFDYCWVPDAPGGDNLGGELSHPSALPDAQVRYLGALSRIGLFPEGKNIGTKEPETANSRLTFIPKLLVLLSGPEPQRTLFEKKVFEQLRTLSCPVTIVRGLPAMAAPEGSPGWRVYEHLPAAEMQEEIGTADIIISRSGYSTIMDVLPAGKRCIFIPTPGQPEQEYLARWLAAKGWCCAAQQGDFSLASLIAEAMRLEVNVPAGLRDKGLLEKAVNEVVRQVRHVP